jgi:hypothetical protein
VVIAKRLHPALTQGPGTPSLAVPQAAYVACTEQEMCCVDCFYMSPVPCVCACACEVPVLGGMSQAVMAL